jgi:hypothetical protein
MHNKVTLADFNDTLVSATGHRLSWETRGATVRGQYVRLIDLRILLGRISPTRVSNESHEVTGPYGWERRNSADCRQREWDRSSIK